MSAPFRVLILLIASAIVPGLALHAQQPAIKDAQKKAETKSAPKSDATKKSTDVERIIEEGTKRSQVMKTASTLTDVIGPRLTGSPTMKRANEWTKTKLTEWGLQNARLEAWGPFGNGWSLKTFSVQVVEPQCIPLIAFPKAWSPGIEGKKTADVVFLDVANEADLAKFKGKLKGKIVLLSAPVAVAAQFEPLAVRKTDEQLSELADAPHPDDAPKEGDGTRMNPEKSAQFRFDGRKLVFAVEEGALAVFDPSRTGDGGTVFVTQASVPGAPPPGTQGTGRRISAWEKDAPKNVPQIAVAKEHYNRLVRMIKEGESLKIALELGVEFHDKDLMGYNTVAEIPGTDLKNEIVMLGGHMDSWHAGTGATDNGAGVSVCMEAVRILKALDLKPRRTIRIALWSGEEQGLLGSKAYVKSHLGEVPGAGNDQPFTAGSGTPANIDKKPEYDKFSAYFNLDNGAGKIRGVYLQGNEAVRPIFRKWLGPFRSMGAATLSISNTDGTDHLSFDAIGLPGFQFIQDEIEYDSQTHHSNQDVFDRIQADDMKQASVIMASFVYDTAMLDEKLPRKTRPAPAKPTAAAR